MPSPSDSALFTREADAFLAAMPPGLQQRQTEAIRTAIEGDTLPLHYVRNARNTPPELSENVKARMITPTLRIYEPSEAGDTPLPAMVYLHGGGWTIGSLNSCGRFCDALAASGQIRVIAVDYRLAPEHPYPAGLDDCINAMKYVAVHAASLAIDPERISIGGDSSGGNLALATALHPECSDLTESLILFYPVTKAYADGAASWEAYGSGYGLDSAIMEAFNDAYTLTADPHDPGISMGDIEAEDLCEALPRTLLVAAGRDILRDQGEELAARLGAKCTRVEFPGAVHLFITVAGQEHAFRKAADIATHFLLQE